MPSFSQLEKLLDTMNFLFFCKSKSRKEILAPDMNGQKLVTNTNENVMKARKSEHKHTDALVNAQRSGQEAKNGLLKAQKSVERMKIW